MKRTLTVALSQTWAMTVAEWLRLLTSPIWSVLLVLWTVVCSLLFQVVVDHASSTELPAGETPVTYFFRGGFGLLALLLVVFIPQLTMEAVAGRRERGRLEHLEVAGLQAGPLVMASFLATAATLVLLLVPPLLIHLVLASQGEADIGHTLGGLLAIFMEACALAALGLCCSCWTPRRVTAALATLSLGMIWWITGAYAPHLAPDLATDGTAGARPWYLSLALHHPIRDFASGLIDVRTVIAFGVLTVGLLALGRLGLLAARRFRLRLATAAATATLGLGLVILGHRIDTHIDVTSRGLHRVSERTVSTLTDLVAKGGVEATILHNPRMRGDPVDGAVLDGSERLVQRLEAHGLSWVAIDSGRRPQVTAALCRELHLAPADLERPLLVLRHGDAHQVIRAEDMAVTEPGADDRPRLLALRCEAALLAAMIRLDAGQVPRVAWLEGPLFRPRHSDAPHRRDACVDAWRRHLAGSGYRLVTLRSWPELAAFGAGLVVLPGPSADLPPAAIAALDAHLAAGGALLVALDGQRGNDLPRLRSLLGDYGLEWIDGVLLTVQGWDGERPELLPVVELLPDADAGPAALAHRDGRALHLPYPVPLRAADPLDSGRRVTTWLPSPPGSRLLAGRDHPVPLSSPRPLLVTAVPETGGTGPRIALLGSVDALADGSLAVAGNRLLATGLAHWLTRGKQAMLLPPQPVEATRYHLSRWQQRWLTWGIGLLLPLQAAAAGLTTWWWRRRP